MEIEQLKTTWETFGRDDPLWAVLTDASRRGGRWDLDEFLATGEGEVAAALGELEQLGAAPVLGRALDFGCGVGRLTQALAERFESCDGVDIAASMIAEGRRINRHGARVQYHVNDSPDLNLFPSDTFDFVLSFIVLQHMEPRYAQRYIAEFVRVLKPGGVALFQIPARITTPPATALPEDAFRASIAIVGRPPGKLSALEQARLRVCVRNLSPHPWPGDARINLGNHWFDAAGHVIAFDDGRTALGADLAPGDERTLELLITAPPLPGRHVLEVDVVQEGVTWFAGRGSRSVHKTVLVRAAPPVRRGLDSGDQSTVGAAFLPMMEMYSVPVEEVEATVVAAGGEVLHMLPDDAAGSGFEGYRYVVRRVATRPPDRPRLSLASLRAAVAAVPDRRDMLPPIVARRQGRSGQLELRVKQHLARATRWLTWAQTEYDHSVLRALRETRDALEEQEAELHRLREELARRREQPDE
jgi:SAM-dependent methyltransferase